MREEGATGFDELRIGDPDAPIRVVELARPERLNALSWDLVDKLGHVLEGIAADESCRAVILTGAGRAFCSGLDLKAREDPVGSDDPITLFFDRQESLAALVETIRHLPVPVIAAVEGPAAGGGFALALACDARVCAAGAVFVASFVRIGLSAGDMGVSYLLPRIVGAGRASEIMLTGRKVDAQEAAAIGLANEVVPDGEARDAARALAERMIGNAPFAIRMTKEVLAANVDAPSLAAALALENRTQAVCSRTADQREALSAFLEKRPPAFSGR
jgi:enoyl-CoA hydratase